MSTENNNLSARSYQKQFKELLQAVFGVNSYYGDFFNGGIEALDGITHKDVAFSVKTSDIPVVVGSTYNKGANVAFGTGTSNSTRFGSRTEIIYTDTDVPYTWEWVYHEGIDKHTVNNSMDAAVSDRLELQAQAKTREFNEHHRDFIASVAGSSSALTGYDDAGVKALFNALAKYFTDVEAVGTKAVKVNPDLYNAVVDYALATTAKNSSVNIDENNIVRFKGFQIQEVPSNMLTATDGTEYAAFAYITGVGKAFTGIETARTIPSEDFDGVALQGAGKAGEFILDDNKLAVVAVTAPVVTP